MTEEETSTELKGYISISEAANRLGVHAKRVHEYIAQGRLKTLTAANMTVVSEKSVLNFERKASGRPRTKPALWHESASHTPFIITVITVQLRSKHQRKLVEKLREMKKKQEHLFPGTMERYISAIDESSGIIEIEMVWKKSGLSDKAEYERQLEAFRETFADVLDWSTAHYKTKTVLLHT